MGYTIEMDGMEYPLRTTKESRLLVITKNSIHNGETAYATASNEIEVTLTITDMPQDLFNHLKQKYQAREPLTLIRDGQWRLQIAKLHNIPLSKVHYLHRDCDGNVSRDDNIQTSLTIRGEITWPEI